MDLELESKYHYLLNDVMLVEISKLSMIIDALNGKRNHNYLSFRAAGCASGVNIGGNVYFNAM